MQQLRERINNINNINGDTNLIQLLNKEIELKTHEKTLKVKNPKTIENITNVVCKYFGFKSIPIGSKKEEYLIVRQISAYMCYKYLWKPCKSRGKKEKKPNSLIEIAQATGHKYHHHVLYTINKVKIYYETEKKYAKMINEIDLRIQTEIK